MLSGTGMVARVARPSVSLALYSLLEEYCEYVIHLYQTIPSIDIMMWSCLILPTIATLFMVNASRRKSPVKTGTEGLYVHNYRLEGPSEPNSPTNRMQRDLDLFNSDIFFQSPDDLRNKQNDPLSCSTVIDTPSSSVYGNRLANYEVDVASLHPPVASSSLLRAHVERNRAVHALHEFPASPATLSELTATPTPGAPSLTSKAPYGSISSSSSIYDTPSTVGTSIRDAAFSKSSKIADVMKTEFNEAKSKLALKHFVNHFYKTIGGNGIRVQLLRKGKLIYRFLRLDREKECLYWANDTSWSQLLRKRREWPVRNIKRVVKGMRVYIESQASKVYALEVEPMEPVRNIASRISVRESILVQDVHIFHEGRALAFDRTLFSYGIETGATLMLQLTPKGRASGSLLQNLDRMVKSQLVKTGPFGFELALECPSSNKVKVYVLYVEREIERDFFVRNFNYLINNLELATTVFRSLNPVTSYNALNAVNKEVLEEAEEDVDDIDDNFVHPNFDDGSSRTSSGSKGRSDWAVATASLQTRESNFETRSAKLARIPVNGLDTPSSQAFPMKQIDETAAAGGTTAGSSKAVFGAAPLRWSANTRTAVINQNTTALPGASR